MMINDGDGFRWNGTEKKWWCGGCELEWRMEIGKAWESLGEMEKMKEMRYGVRLG